MKIEKVGFGEHFSHRIVRTLKCYPLEVILTKILNLTHTSYLAIFSPSSYFYL